jgi:hypothetical protein
MRKQSFETNAREQMQTFLATGNLEMKTVTLPVRSEDPSALIDVRSSCVRTLSQEKSFLFTLHKIGATVPETLAGALCASRCVLPGRDKGSNFVPTRVFSRCYLFPAEAPKYRSARSTLCRRRFSRKSTTKNQQLTHVFVSQLSRNSSPLIHFHTPCHKSGEGTCARRKNFSSLLSTLTCPEGMRRDSRLP